MDARFVDRSRWRLWRENFQDGNGKIVRRHWAVDLANSKAPMLVEVLRPYRSILGPRIAFLLGGAAVLYLAFWLIRPEWLRMTICCALFFVWYLAFATYSSMRPSHTYQPTGGKNRDWDTIKRQVADLFYAASTAPTFEAMRALAKTTPEHFISRRDEIVRLFRDEKGNNPIRSDDRRTLLAEFATEVIPEAVETMRRDAYTGDDPEKREKARKANIDALRSALQHYQESEHRVLLEVMHTQYVTGKPEAGIDGEVLQLVTNAINAHSDRERASEHIKQAITRRFPDFTETEVSWWHAWAMDLREEMLRK